MYEVLIAADDRTGAMEVAGECAARSGRPVVVAPAGVEATAPEVVVDLGSRHLEPAEAASRTAALDAIAVRRAAHKIDSALRGNWAAELLARRADRTVLVPALPAMGRVCVDGVVAQVDGTTAVPVAVAMADDPRGAPAGSRPADLLRDAGARDVVELADPSALAGWLADGRSGIAVCDVATVADLDALGRLVADAGVLMAGTAAAIGAWHTDATATTTPIRGTTVLVVCGSLDTGARRQLDVLHAAGHRGLVVVTSPQDATGRVGDDVAEATAAALAAEARATIDAQRPDVVVVLGGDTTAAVVADAAMRVTGLVEPGMPLSRRADGTGPWFVTRSGSFGGPTSLRDLVGSILVS